MWTFNWWWRWWWWWWWWRVCRLEWPKDHYFPPCVVKFRDGWEPPALPSVTPSRDQELTQLAESLANAEVQRHEELRTRLAQEVRIPAATPYIPNNRKRAADVFFTSCVCAAVGGAEVPPCRRVRLLQRPLQSHADPGSGHCRGCF